MKEQKIYVCELCETQYKEKSEALKCESGHKVAKKIDKSSYHAKCDFPDRVVVEFIDGSRCFYKR